MARFHNLFFALRPPPAVAAEIERLRHEQGLPGPWLPRERLHISLLSLGKHPVLPLRLIDRVSELLSEQQLPETSVAFDQWVNGRRSALLGSRYPLHDIERLQAQLGECLKQEGIVAERWLSKPHITLGYNVRTGPVQSIKPLSWIAKELVLIDSLYGEGKHLVQGRWRLGGGKSVDPLVRPISNEPEQQLSLFA